MDILSVVFLSIITMAGIGAVYNAQEYMMAVRGFYAAREHGVAGNPFVVVEVDAARGGIPPGLRVGSFITHVAGRSVARSDDAVVQYLLTEERYNQFHTIFYGEEEDVERGSEVGASARLTAEEEERWVARVSEFYNIEIPQRPLSAVDLRERVLHRIRQQNYSERTRRGPVRRDGRQRDEQKDDVFSDNFSRETSQCNSYYKHPRFGWVHCNHVPNTSTTTRPRQERSRQPPMGARSALHTVRRALNTGGTTAVWPPEREIVKKMAVLATLVGLGRHLRKYNIS